MDKLIITDYFGSDNNTENTEDKSEENKQEEKKEEIKIEKIEIKEEEKPAPEVKIIMPETESKIIIPKDILMNKKRANELTQKLVEKTKRNTKLELKDFFTKNRHFLIMSEGGKPVYSRYGDCIENNSIFATLSAMITKYTVFNSDKSIKENLNIITNNKNKIVFLKKGQLIFIVITKKDDCISLLYSQLEYLYTQLMSILTISFYSKLEDNPSKCLRAMSGTENLFEQIIQYSSKSFISLFNAYQVMNYFEERNKLNKIVDEYRGDALYCIIMTPYEIISLSKSNQINIVASDIVLIQTLIFCQEMLRSQESFVPICLPGISEQGYIQFYSNFSEENIGVIFVTENMDPTFFIKFQEQYKKLYKRLEEENLIEKILNTFRLNNNIYGEYNLNKNDNTNNNDSKKEKPKDITAKILMDEIIKKMAKKGKFIIKKERSSKSLINLQNNSQNNKNNNENSMSDNVVPLIKQYTLDKMINKVFDGIKYGVVLHRKLRQYILFNFDMDFRVLNKFEKNLIHEYNILYDKALYELNNNEDFFCVQKSKNFVNVIEINENFLCICSYNFFIDYEEAGKKMKDVLKYIKKNEQKFFILFK